MIHFNKRRAVLVLIAIVATFAIIRVCLHSSPNADFNIGRYNIHHLFMGLLLVTFCGIPLVVLEGNNRVMDFAAIGSGAGMSLALDEWAYLITTDGSNASYLLPISFWGGVILVGLACMILSVVWLPNTKAKGETK